MEGLENILQCILSSDKPTRTQGESWLESQCKSHPTQVLQSLFSALTSSSEELSVLASVIFRKMLLNSSLMSSVPKESKDSLKSMLLSLAGSPPSFLFAKRLSDCTLVLAFASNTLEELLHYIQSWLSDPNPLVKSQAFYMLDIGRELPGFCELVMRHKDAFMDLVCVGLKDSTTEVQLLAANTFLSYDPNSAHFDRHIGSVLSLISNINPTYNLEMLNAVLISMADLTEIRPGLWNSDSLITVLVPLVKSLNIPTNTRCSAANVLMVYIKNAVSGLSTYALQELSALAFILMGEAPYALSLEAWSAEEESAVSSADTFNLGMDMLGALSECIGDPVFPLTSTLIFAHLQGTNWLNHHAGILGAGIAASNSPLCFKSVFHNILHSVLNFASNNHPRIQWSLLKTIEILTVDFSEEFYMSFYSQILPIVLFNLAPSTLPKVSTQAAKTLGEYARGLLSHKELIQTAFLPYVPGLYQAYYVLLSSANLNLSLLRELLNSLCLCTEVIEAETAKYFEMFVPGLLSIINCPAQTYELKEVRAAGIECLSAIMTEVTDLNPSYLEQTLEIARQLYTMKNSIEESDPGLAAIQNTMVQFALILGDLFNPYLEAFVPEVLAAAAQNVEICMIDSSDTLPSDRFSVMCLDTIGLGPKQIGIDKNALTHKIRAVKIIYSMADDLKERYSPYALESAKVIGGLFRYNFSNEIRRYAFKAAPRLIESSIASKEEITMILMPYFQQAIVETYKKNLAETKQVLQSLSESLDLVFPISFIGLSGAFSLSKITSDVLSETTENNKKTRCRILKRIVEIIGALLKSFRQEFLGCFTDMFKNKFGQILYDKNASDEEILYSICMFDDLVEYTGDLLMNQNVSLLIPKLIEFCFHPDPEIRQNAAYGIGLCAQNGSSIFPMYLDSAVNALQHILALPEAQHKFIVSSENAAGAIGKIAVLYDERLIPMWANWLPFRSDPDEARSIHDLFVNNIEKMKNWKELAGNICMQLSSLDPAYITSEAKNQIPRALMLINNS